MVKHLLNEKDKGKNVIWNGCTFKSVGREVYLPEAVPMYNPVIEEKDDKEDLVNKAHELGLGSPSTLKRLSVETLKERIEEAE